jgi:hypothetical protein
VRTLVFLSAMVALAGGCQCAQLQPGAGFLCDANGDCPDGQRCDDTGVCFSTDAGGGPNDGGGGSGGSGGGSGGAGGGGNAVSTTSVRITDPADDGTWCNSIDETLDVGSSATVRWVEVGTDATQCRTGLRFFPGVPVGATVLDARIRVKVVYSTAALSSRVAVQVYDSASVGPFVDGHRHLPKDHADGGFITSLIERGWVVDAGVGKLTHSPNLSAQVQAIVDRPDYDATRPVTFELEPDDPVTGWYIGFGDSGLDAGAELIVTWQ